MEGSLHDDSVTTAAVI